MKFKPGPYRQNVADLPLAPKPQPNFVEASTLINLFQYAAFAVSRLSDTTFPIPPIFADFGTSLLGGVDHHHHLASQLASQSSQHLSDAKTFQETFSKLWMTSQVNSLLSLGANSSMTSSSSLASPSTSTAIPPGPSSFLTVTPKSFQVTHFIVINSFWAPGPDLIKNWRG